MPAGLEGNGWEDEGNRWWTAVFCRPSGRRQGPLRRDWQSHLWTNSGKGPRCSLSTDLLAWVSYSLAWFLISLFIMPDSSAFMSLSSSDWEECVLCSRPGSYNEAVRPLANPHVPNSTLLCCQIQQQPNCYWSPRYPRHWIHLHQ